MNKDINFTLSAFVPLLRMNGEKVVSVEAVEDWYEIDGREYMKEVAEITYENGYRQYADIGCDANLTAVYDVIRVIQQVKPKSEKIERIVRNVYPKPEIPDTNAGDNISRQAVLALPRNKTRNMRGEIVEETIDVAYIEQLPSVQPMHPKGEWLERKVFDEPHGEHIEQWQSAKCSVCGKYHTTPYLYYFDWFDWCPNCGADCRGRTDDA